VTAQLINVGEEQFVLLPLSDYERPAKAARLLAAGFPEAEPAISLDSPSPIPSDGGSRLRAWRTFRGLTQEELGRAVGKPKSFISQIEVGRSFGKPVLWRKLAQALQTEIEAILPKDE
jgi:DNA-binding XRE family transcriptional regulator